MKCNLQTKAAAYLLEILGAEATFSRFPGAERLPLHITETYQIDRCELLGKAFLSLRIRRDKPTLAAMTKQSDWLHLKTGLRSLFVLESVSSYDRKRLIENKTPFLVPGLQMYLPDLGLDLRENFKIVRGAVEKLSLPGQVVVLACILRRIDPHAEFTGASLAERFGYTKMTMTRALDEMRHFEFVEVQGGRRFARHRFLVTGNALWRKAMPVLRSPVKKRIYLDEWSAGLDFQAGETALSEQTDLGFSRRAVWAVTSSEWKHLLGSPDIRIIPNVSKDMAHAEFEVWHYAPKLLAEKPFVDPLSLALSLGKHPDERVDMSIEQLFKLVPW